MTHRPDPADTVPDGTVRRVCVLARLWEPGLGDLVQRNIPLDLLRRAYPAARITYVLPDGVAARFQELLAHHTYADEVLTCPDEGDERPQRWRTCRDQLRHSDFDLCLVDPDSRGLGGIQAAECGIPRRLGFAASHTGTDGLTEVIRLPRPVFAQPDLYDYAVGLGRTLGVEVGRPAEALPPLPYTPRPVAAMTPPVIALHPGGARHWNRRWPQPSFAALAGRLTAVVGTLLLIGAADEAEELRSLAHQIPTAPTGSEIRILAGSPLNELANLLSHTDLLVGNDSAPAHLAAALGRPTIVLYGPTQTEFMWTRIYPRHHGINLRYACQRVRNLPRGAGTTTMPCDFSCPYPYTGPDGAYPRCLSDISVDTVHRAALAQLSHHSPLTDQVGGVP